MTYHGQARTVREHFDDVEAVDAGHHKVGHDDIDGVPLQLNPAQGGLSVFRLQHPAELRLQHSPHEVSDDASSSALPNFQSVAPRFISAYPSYN